MGDLSLVLALAPHELEQDLKGLSEDDMRYTKAPPQWSKNVMLNF